MRTGRSQLAPFAYLESEGPTPHPVCANPHFPLCVLDAVFGGRLCRQPPINVHAVRYQPSMTICLRQCATEADLFAPICHVFVYQQICET